MPICLKQAGTSAAALIMSKCSCEAEGRRAARASLGPHVLHKSSLADTGHVIGDKLGWAFLGSLVDIDPALYTQGTC